MRNLNTYALLEFIKDSAMGVVDFLEAFSTSGRSTKLFLRKLRELERKRLWQKHESLRTSTTKKDARKYRLLFYRLKRDGLLAEINDKVVLTRKGKSYLKVLKQKLILPTPVYTKEPSTRTIIVIFDVPEDLRRERAWLRSVLRNLGFKMFQQSVWSGQNRIPEGFLKDLDGIGLAQYVEIFEVVRYGSLSGP